MGKPTEGPHVIPAPRAKGDPEPKTPPPPVNAPPDPAGHSDGNYQNVGHAGMGKLPASYQGPGSV
jgi:hypothetical protein